MLRFLLPVVLASSAVAESLERIAHQKAFSVYDIGFRRAGVDFCGIPKNGHTITNHVLCDLYRFYQRQRFVPDYNLNTEIVTQCEIFDYYPELIFRTPAWTPKKGFVKFAVIREPTERFVSLYKHVCGLWNMCLNMDVHQFAKNLYHLFLEGYQPKNIDDHNMFMIEFHAQPQSWFCDFQNKRQPYKLVLFSKDSSELRDGIEEVFEEARVPRKFSEAVLKHFDLSSTTHASDSTEETRILNAVKKNATTMEYLRAIYYEDFDLYEKAEAQYYE